MEKRYQVFISSTFQDLQGARQEVSQALLRADCFPAGMELFPAADEEQFEFIKTVIDQSDYYIIISAGRYGSIHPETGLSYTEMEYDYAVEIGKPVIRLLHRDHREIADENDEKFAKLLKFRTKMSASRLVAFWSSPAELGKEVVYALLDLKKSRPAKGWLRGDFVATTDAEKEIIALKQKILELEVELTQARLEQKEQSDPGYRRKYLDKRFDQKVELLVEDKTFPVQFAQRILDDIEERRSVSADDGYLQGIIQEFGVASDIAEVIADYFVETSFYDDFEHEINRKDLLAALVEIRASDSD